MSIWKVSPQEDMESSEPFVRNTIAWDQLLNNLDLQTSSDSSESSDGNVEVFERSRASTFSDGKLSHQSRRLHLCPSSPNSRECAKMPRSPVGVRGDDGYSSEDEHDSPANPDSAGSCGAGFCPSSGLTATTKAGSTVSQGSGPATPDDVGKSYFFVNGVRHCVQDEANGSRWSVPLPGLPEMLPTPKTLGTDQNSWATVHSHPDNVAPMTKTVIASNDTGAPAAWAYTPKAAVHHQVSQRSPPRYEVPRAVPGGYAMAPSQDFRTMSGAPAMPANTPYYPTSNMSMGAAAAMPGPHTPSGMPMPPSNAAPFYAGNPVPVNGAATAANSFVGYIYMDKEGRLCVASGGNSPLPSTPQVPLSACPPPPAAYPAQQAQPRRSFAATAALQGATTMPEMKPMQLTNSYAADESVSQPAVLPMPVPKPVSSGWGSTKAWVFRENRWISLST